MRVSGKKVNGCGWRCDVIAADIDNVVRWLDDNYPNLYVVGNMFATMAENAIMEQRMFFKTEEAMTACKLRWG